MNTYYILSLVLLALGVQASAAHMANGVKIGEVTSESAIVWTRLTTTPTGNIDGKQFPKTSNRDRASALVKDLAQMEGSAPGCLGEVRITYHPANDKASIQSTGWKTVDQKKDFTRQFTLKDLKPATQYLLAVEGRPVAATEPTCKLEASFTTAPAPSTASKVSFTVVTGQDYPRRDTPDGHKIYPVMQQLMPSFFVHTGDIEYYDKPGPYADTVELARFKWNRLYALPHQRAFHNKTPSYFMKDDHDTLKNDCWPGQTYGKITWNDGLALFKEQVPMGQKTYRTFR
ncbi:MAG: PhoD-like phosphatase N-terminal domain-containing protein, partial [Akkermansiaceae bacterium]